MSLRVNTNITAFNAHRNLLMTDSLLQKSIERLSSGLRINRAADDPANFITSEQQRTLIASVDQAISNTVDAQSMVQTVEGTYDEIEGLLRSMRTLALHASNTGPNDSTAVANDQAQIKNAIAALENIATTRKYGSKVLLDGSIGKQAVVSMSSTFIATYSISINFVNANNDTNITNDVLSYGAKGTLLGAENGTVAGSNNIGTYSGAQKRIFSSITGQMAPWVKMTTQAFGSTATAGGDPGNLGQDETLTINGVSISLTSGMTVLEAVDRINTYVSQTGASAVAFSREASAAGVTSFIMGSIGDAAGTTAYIQLYSTHPGLDYTIDVNSDTPNSTVKTSGFGASASTILTGADITGNFHILYLGATGTVGASLSSITINATSDGNMLTPLDTSIKLNIYGKGWTTVTLSGLKVEQSAVGTIVASDGSITYTLASLNADTLAAGGISIELRNAPVTFQIGANAGESVTLSINSASPYQLGTSLRLSEIDVRSINGATKALSVIDQSLDDVLKQRGEIGSFQKQFLESTKGNLRMYKENLQAAESNIRDVDVAQEMISFTRHQILMQSGTAVLAQANLAPQSVLQLLR